MGKAKVELNLAGFHALRTSPEMQAILSTKAGEIRNRAGDGFSSGVKAGPKTAVARVWPNGKEGMRAEAKNGALSKAVGGWGGSSK